LAERAAGAGLRARSVLLRPSEDELRALTAVMPSATRTSFGNYNIATRVGARSRSSTFIVTDEPDRFSDETISRAEGERIAELQDAYLARRDVVVVDGFLGHGEPHRTPARLVVERTNANLAAMQQHLFYAPEEGDTDVELTTITTPGLSVPGYPNDRVIAVWLEEGLTRVLNSDYFDESKKAGLRMWASRVYEAGGLVIHAGCKVAPSSRGPKTILIVGLPDTGKTSITFAEVNGSKVLQDDFVALLPGGRILATQNGFVEKTYGLDPRMQPAIYGAAIHPDTYLENVSLDGQEPDFSRERNGRSGRAVFNLRSIDAYPARRVPDAFAMLILNRSHAVIPALARLDPSRAVRHFMLRDLRGWTARDAHGEGSLPGPRLNQSFLGIAQRSTRFAELLGGCSLQVYLMNTGWIGGGASDEGAKRVGIAHSAAILSGLCEDRIEWEWDADLELEVAAEVPGVDDRELLQPRRLYARRGRLGEYRERVERLRREWYAPMSWFPVA
jgi:phosphoenolpyruvate carboxykinase (ATP)